MDVQEFIAGWQAGLPGSARVSDTITPDTAALASWMADKLATSGGLKLRSADPLIDCVTRYLLIEGVDIEHELRRAEDGREAAASRVRVTADTIRRLAVSLKKAERKMAFEQEGLADARTGFTASQVRAAAAEVTRTEAELLEACGNDRAVARAARRAAG